MDALCAESPPGIAGRPGRDALRHVTFTRWVWGAAAISMAGGGIVSLFLAFAAPILLSPDATDRLLLRGGATLAVFLTVAVPVLLRNRRRRFRVGTRWLGAGRPPTDTERQMVLAAPAEAARMSAIMWGIGAVVFALLGVTETISAALYIFATVVLGGISTSAVWYLVVERIMRPMSARALCGDAPDRRVGPTIQLRLTMAWTLATGVPLLGVMVLTVGYLADVGFAAQPTFVAILLLIVVAIAVGLFAILIAVRSVAERIRALRRALARVQAGDFGARVEVDDSSEIGRLQAGFNTMAAGLAERERIRDAFGVYVDHDVAEHILDAGATLPGEEVEVTLMFVDVRGFTAFAEKLRPADVVATLNRLFERIVPLVHLHGGHVDKYAGDGLMAVFGAPRRHIDHADRALTAALEIADAVSDEFTGTLSVGIGLNSGPVVAGNVGGAGRLEFSVIGDAVNVAARVESATRQTGDSVLVTGRTMALLKGIHGDFVERPGLALKGKTTPVQIYAPGVSARVELQSGFRGVDVAVADDGEAVRPDLVQGTVGRVGGVEPAACALGGRDLEIRAVP
ncbi:family 3 adenylate cyclase [Mycolicibacterium mageritense DSM 44476 = CIP 104973]|nr:family 3 adenylate cyclase [Mycolicibacterium mageritense DSM 44476 = CIP 104973]